MVSSPVAQPVGCACELEIDVQEIETVASEVVLCGGKRMGNKDYHLKGTGRAWVAVQKTLFYILCYSATSCEKLEMCSWTRDHQPGFLDVASKGVMTQVATESSIATSKQYTHEYARALIEPGPFHHDHAVYSRICCGASGPDGGD